MKEVSPQDVARSLVHVRPTNDGQFTIIISNWPPPTEPIGRPPSMWQFATEEEALDREARIVSHIASTIDADRQRQRVIDGDALYAVYLDAFASGQMLERACQYNDDMHAAVALGIAHRNGGGGSVMEGPGTAFDRPALVVPRLASKRDVLRIVANLCGATVTPAETKIDVTLDGKPLMPQSRRILFTFNDEPAPDRAVVEQETAAPAAEPTPPTESAPTA